MKDQPSPSRGSPPKTSSNSSSLIGRKPARRSIARTEVSGRKSKLPSSWRSSTTYSPASSGSLSLTRTGISLITGIVACHPATMITTAEALAHGIDRR